MSSIRGGGGVGVVVFSVALHRSKVCVRACTCVYLLRVSDGSLV